MDITAFYQTFFDEADEPLADMEQHLLELDPEEPDIEQLNAIFQRRALHQRGRGDVWFQHFARNPPICWKTYSMVHVVMKCG